MKNTIPVRLLFAGTTLYLFAMLSSCTKEYVVKPEDIQAYLDKGADLTITLPAGSSFDLVDVNGKLQVPGRELEGEPTPTTPPANPADSAANDGANGEKKFRHAGAFVQQAFAAEGAYHCPSVCQIIIRTPL
ncbi:MAG: hypothetical protein K1X61_00165 [Chitinophagales bacterium]|nr:hypothetical protein [Chitinophagales bacterium]